MSISVTPSSNRGFILKMGAAASEVAPLKGYSVESVSQTLDALIRFEALGIPSLSFALDSLLLQQKFPITKGIISTSRLINSPHQAANYSAVKLKIKNRSIDEILTLVDGIDPKVRIRLDANCGFNLSEALKIARELPAGRIEYIEEPTKTFDELIQFSLNSPIPIAVDEHLRSQPLVDILNLNNVATWVVKPTLTGSLGKIFSLANRAKKQGIPITLSSSFESPIGLMTIAHLAHVLKLDHPQGLGTDHSLTQGGCIDLAQFHRIAADCSFCL